MTDVVLDRDEVRPSEGVSGFAWPNPVTSFGIAWHPITPLAQVGHAVYTLRVLQPSSWIPDAVARLNEVAAAGVGWDGAGAPAPTSEALLVAATLLGYLARAPLAPNVVPTVRGGVQFEWHRGDSDVEIEVSPDGRVEAWVEDRRTSEYFDGEISTIFRRLLGTLDRMADR